MKKFNRWFAVTLVICMLLSVSAYAVGTDRTPLCGKPGIEQPELPEKPGFGGDFRTARMGW